VFARLADGMITLIIMIAPLFVLGLTQVTDFLACVGSFFALQGEKRTYQRRKVLYRDNDDNFIA
jgi:hypothetical protein